MSQRGHKRGFAELAGLGGRGLPLREGDQVAVADDLSAGGPGSVGLLVDQHPNAVGGVLTQAGRAQHDGRQVIGNADGGNIGTPASAGSAAPAPSTARTGTGNLSVNQTYRGDWAGVVDIRVTTTTTSPGPLGLPTTQEAQAEGAGVVFDKNGDILTDEHVVAGARTATVTFGDGITAKAKVIGTDPSTDVAVIRVSAAASELHPIPFANSESAWVGDPVVAIGSPFGLPET